MGKQLFVEQTSDPDKAKALHQLIIKRINERLKLGPEMMDQALSKATKKLGNNKFNKGQLLSFLKENDYDAYRVIQNLKSESKTLKRSLGEFLATDPDFFQRKGLFNVLLARDESELTKTLKSFDNTISGTKDADALAKHHGHLSSLRNLLNNVSSDWKNRFTKIAEEHGYKFGDEGIQLFDVVAHKPLDPIKSGPLKGNINPKGILADMGLPALPREGDTVFHRVLGKLEELAAHGNYAGGTLGLSLAEDLGHLEPEEAFKIARNLLDVEKVQNAQGHRLHSILKNWQKNKAKYGGNIEAAFSDLEKTLLREKAPNVTGLIDEYKSNLAASRKVGQRLGGIGNTIKISKGVAQGSRVLKKLAKFAPIPVASTLLGIGSHAMAKEEYEQNPNALNWTQLQGERLALGGSGLSSAGVPLLTNPFTAPAGLAMIGTGETVDAVGTGISLGTDVIKGAMDPAKISTKGRTRYSSGANKPKKENIDELWRSVFLNK